MARLPFTKMQAVGNDFVVVDEAAWPADTEWHKAAVFLCDRKFGVGSDGLLVVGPSQTADVRMRMFNPDGTEDMCGNGLRCVIHRARETGLFTGDEGTAECLPGLYPFWIRPKGIITVNMGEPKFDREDVPYDYNFAVKEWDERYFLSPYATSTHAGNVIRDWDNIPLYGVYALNTGSTHAVLPVEKLPDDEEFFKVSPMLEHHPFFPKRASIMWATIEPPDTIRLRIWERGAGETLGCGTGACAAAVAARMVGALKTERIRVVSKGGTLFVDTPKSLDWGQSEVYEGTDSGPDDAQEHPIFLSGRAETVYSGDMEYPHAQS